MVTVPQVPQLTLRPPWNVLSTRPTHYSSELRVRGHSAQLTVRVERCAAGRLRNAYPVGAHDTEVGVHGTCPPAALPDLLQALTDAVTDEDPRCRRVVFAPASTDQACIRAADAAGFRYVLDVDLGTEAVSLLVAEPLWVTRTDMDLDRVPGS
ncbi:GNAT family N-acetyltransferase [Streptomyces sp. NPDC050535]|uniref:GNAT family N-acetyltransferase n=1 Tax=Streptomyces sp. NPDC050535 TaxID=3365626 RepID=UPI0037B7DF7E